MAQTKPDGRITRSPGWWPGQAGGGRAGAVSEPPVRCAQVWHQPSERWYNPSVLQPIDVHHQGLERVIGVYLTDTPEGPALFDCGPATCFERLREAVDLSEIRH